MFARPGIRWCGFPALRRGGVSDVLLLVRLALATGLLLAPGWLIARALAQRGIAATLAWSLTVLFGALAVTFAAGASLRLTLGLVLGAGLAALPFARGARRARVPYWREVGAAGVALGLLLWLVAGERGGDGLFHLGRVQKLLAFDDLSLEAVDEFADGGLHPGYAFPLWHGFLALVAKVSFADPAEVVEHLPSVLAPLAVLVAYEAGYALFRSAVPAAASAAAGVALVGMAPGNGGALTVLSLPATASRQLLVPAALALAFAFVRAPSLRLAASAAAAALAVAVVHPTYALFLLVPFAGFALVRWAWTREDARAGALALASLAATPAAFFVWLLPVVGDTASVSPDAAERARALQQYQGQLVVYSEDSFRLSGELFGRAGPAAVGALLLLPLAGLAARRRWAAYVVGGALAVFLLTLVPVLFTALSDAVSLSQARRLAGFLPFAFSLAGGMGVLAALLGPFVAPLALTGGIAFQLLYPGDFNYVLTEGGPAWVTWLAVAGAVAALAWGFLRRPPVETTAALASALFLAPVFVHGFSEWSPSPAFRPAPLTPGLIAALRDDVPERAIVFSDPETSYGIAAFAPVYVCNGPPAHVADTEDNRPYERRAEALRFLETGDLAIPRACGATWLVVDAERSELAPDLPVAYRDDRFTLYRLGAGSP
jgi:hypothetical protein